MVKPLIRFELGERHRLLFVTVTSPIDRQEGRAARRAKHFFFHFVKRYKYEELVYAENINIKFRKLFKTTKKLCRVKYIVGFSAIRP